MHYSSVANLPLQPCPRLVALIGVAVHFFLTTFPDFAPSTQAPVRHWTIIILALHHLHSIHHRIRLHHRNGGLVTSLLIFGASRRVKRVHLSRLSHPVWRDLEEEQARPPTTPTRQCAMSLTTGRMRTMPWYVDLNLHSPTQLHCRSFPLHPTTRIVRVFG